MNPLDLKDLIDGEPPYVLAADAAIASGKRRRRQRQGAVLGTFVLTAGVVGGGVLLLGSGTAANHDQVFATSPTASVTQAPAGPDAVYLAIAKRYSPAGWDFSTVQVDQFGWYGNVDGGQGANRLGLAVSTGGLQPHPCSDPEYVDGATCTVTHLDANTDLIVRGASHYKGYSSIFAEIVHPDGSGSEATIDNSTAQDIPPGTVIDTQAEKERYSLSTIHTVAPIYTADQLVEMVKALEATR